MAIYGMAQAWKLGQDLLHEEARGGKKKGEEKGRREKKNKLPKSLPSSHQTLGSPQNHVFHIIDSNLNTPMNNFNVLLILCDFLNQACAGHRPVCAWFLRIASVRECLYACVFVCVCVSAPEAINN